MFTAFGAKDVSILNGGFGKWDSEGKTKSEGAAAAPVDRVLDNSWELQSEWVATLEDAHKASAKIVHEDPEAPVIIDSRGEANFSKGTVEGAICCPTPDMFNEDKTFISDEDMAEKFSKANLEGKWVMFTCGAGIFTCTGIFCLERVGHQQPISMYDGSWQEYAKYKVPDFKDPDWEKSFTRIPREE